MPTNVRSLAGYDAHSCLVTIRFGANWRLAEIINLCFRLDIIPATAQMTGNVGKVDPSAANNTYPWGLNNKTANAIFYFHHNRCKYSEPPVISSPHPNLLPKGEGDIDRASEYLLIDSLRSVIMPLPANAGLVFVYIWRTLNS